jgi:hypothetical protein
MDLKKILKSQETLRINKVKDIKWLREIKKNYSLPFDVRIRKIKEEKGYKVFLVDADKIRDLIDIDFTMGGHGFRYVYIPEGEIWIDSDNQDEKEAIILHEFTEAELMKNGMNYYEAHDLSCEKEIALRTKKVILPVGHHRQVTPWSCGPSALKIVLDFYENKINPGKLISETECTTEGTLHKGLRKILDKLGYKYIEKEKATIDDIEEFIIKGIPVIVDYQAYHGGHFSTIIGFDENRFYISDPASDKKYKWIKKQDFEKRWHEEDEPGKIVNRWLLAVYRKK